MFTRQSPLIYNSLLQGGLSAASASAFHNLVGQCRAPIVHRGPVQFDYTRPSMRLITPEAGRFEFPGLVLDPPQSFPNRFDPPEMPPMPPMPDMPPLPEPPPPLEPECLDCGWPWNPWEPWDPGEPPPDPPRRCDEQCDYRPGKYIDINGRIISLRYNDKEKHCIFKLGRVDSVRFEGSPFKSDLVKIKVLEGPGVTRFHAQPDVKKQKFVSNVTIGEDGIFFEISEVPMFKGAKVVDDVKIELTDCPEEEPPPGEPPP